MNSSFSTEAFYYLGTFHAFLGGFITATRGALFHDTMTIERRHSTPNQFTWEPMQGP